MTSTPIGQPARIREELNRWQVDPHVLRDARNLALEEQVVGRGYAMDLVIACPSSRVAQDVRIDLPAIQPPRIREELNRWQVDPHVQRFSSSRIRSG